MKIPFHITHSDGQWTEDEKVFMFDRLLDSLRQTSGHVNVTLNEGTEKDPRPVSAVFTDSL